MSSAQLRAAVFAFRTTALLRGGTTCPKQVEVAVTSHNWGDITVYLIAGGVPQRLGMVSSGGVRLRALPVAGRPFTSETILVLPGQAIFWTLENNLETSNFTVY